MYHVYYLRIMSEKLRIVFMGTPAFAVPSLDILVKAGYDIAAVITAPDKPAGRGQQLQQSAVKQYALQEGIPVLQPVKLKDPAFIEELRSLNANLFIVVAFRMLPEVVWSMPRLGTFNLHASLLPQYRGAAPINWAIINGEKETGVTTFFLKHEIDTGDLIFQTAVPIHDDDTAGTLSDVLMQVGSQLVLRTVQAIESGEVKTTPQKTDGIIKHAPKLSKEDGQLDFSKSAEQVRNHIRGLSPYPGAYTWLDGKMLKVYAANIIPDMEGKQTGEFASDGKSFLRVQCGKQALELKEVQLEGKKKMGVEEFLRGYRMNIAN
jgi:methionyl-tRNA formyltransferase